MEQRSDAYHWWSDEEWWLDGGWEQGRLIVRLGGELDITAGELSVAASHLADRLNTRQVALDLRKVTFIDCAGVGILLTICRHLRDSGAQVTIDSCSAEVERVLALVGWTWSPPGPPLIDLSSSEEPCPADAEVA